MIRIHYRNRQIHGIASQRGKSGYHACLYCAPQSLEGSCWTKKVLRVCHPARLPLELLLKDCRVTRTRGSGPGGQHRNKVETAIVVEHLPSGLRGEASERRSQDQNRQQAIQRLRIQLALGVRRSSGNELSRAWQQRLQARRISVNPEHEDFPALLAEAIDVVASYGYEISAAANQLEVTASQLVKFLKIKPRALELVNRERLAVGRSKLR